jgi:hypothetical protein
MSGAAEEPPRRRVRAAIDEQARAERVIELAWRDLPADDRHLLENIGAAQWVVERRGLGEAIDDLRRSAGYARLTGAQRLHLDRAAGAWLQELRVVLINASHEALRGLNDRSYEAMLVRIAWHEWGHALSVVRATQEDLANGVRLLGLAPPGVQATIRAGRYRKRDYTVELIAEIYALLMARRRRGGSGRPEWLNDEIHDLLTRVTGWTP